MSVRELQTYEIIEPCFSPVKEVMNIIDFEKLGVNGTKGEVLDCKL